MRDKTQIEFHGHILDVSYEYEKYVPAKLTADPYDSHDAEGGWCEVLTVKLDGKDITDLMGEERVNELSEKIAESL
jgi:hypothetical protein